MQFVRWSARPTRFCFPKADKSNRSAYSVPVSSLHKWVTTQVTSGIRIRNGSRKISNYTVPNNEKTSFSADDNFGDNLRRVFDATIEQESSKWLMIAVNFNEISECTHSKQLNTLPAKVNRGDVASESDNMAYYYWCLDLIVTRNKLSLSFSLSKRWKFTVPCCMTYKDVPIRPAWWMVSRDHGNGVTIVTNGKSLVTGLEMRHKITWLCCDVKKLTIVIAIWNSNRLELLLKT